MRKTKFNNIEELFAYVLAKYEEAEECCIGELCSNIDKAEKELQAEIALYKSEFKRLNGEQAEFRELKEKAVKKVESYKDKHYCECGCPVEIMLDGITLKPIGGQVYCDQCGAKLDWNEFVEKGE